MTDLNLIQLANPSASPLLQAAGTVAYCYATYLAIYFSILSIHRISSLRAALWVEDVRKAGTLWRLFTLLTLPLLAPLMLVWQIAVGKREPKRARSEQHIPGYQDPEDQP